MGDSGENVPEVKMNSARVPCGPDIFLFITMVSIIISNAITAHVRAPVGFINNLALKAGDDAIRRGPMRLKLANEEADDDDHREYEDFPQEPTFLQASYLVPQNDIRSSNSKVIFLSKHLQNVTWVLRYQI